MCYGNTQVIYDGVVGVPEVELRQPVEIAVVR